MLRRSINGIILLLAMLTIVITGGVAFGQKDDSGGGGKISPGGGAGSGKIGSGFDGGVASPYARPAIGDGISNFVRPPSASMDDILPAPKKSRPVPRTDIDPGGGLIGPPIPAPTAKGAKKTSGGGMSPVRWPDPSTGPIKGIVEPPGVMTQTNWGPDPYQPAASDTAPAAGTVSPVKVTTINKYFGTDPIEPAAAPSSPRAQAVGDTVPTKRPAKPVVPMQVVITKYYGTDPIQAATASKPAKKTPQPRPSIDPGGGLIGPPITPPGASAPNDILPPVRNPVPKEKRPKQ